MFHAPVRLPRLAKTVRAAAIIAASFVVATAATPVAQAQRIAAAPEVSVEELMKPGDLADIAIGQADAKVTVVEYSSLTCPHCASFQAKVFPAFKAKYIDTGKVRFITREFPLDNLAAAAAMLARCIAPEKSFDFVETMFATQEIWGGHNVQNPKAKLFEIAKQAGFTEATFEKCLTDQVLLDKLTALRTRASEKFQINSTPTFFVNGKRVSGNTNMVDFEKVIEPLLGAK
ncbi:MAG: thioredoxin domain-containing protein [Hyphomicrobiaceae bacterium]